MYDELIKRLRDAATMSEAFAVLLPHSAGNATAKLYNEAADAIDELTRENESLAKSVNEASEILRRRWIPVTERLPENGERVLVYSLYWGVREDLRFMGKFERSDVTHWMPLPQAPKEEA